jgi:hypothetical protein
LLVQDEEVEVSISLKNNHHFDLEITSLTLLYAPATMIVMIRTSGVEIDMLPSSFILPAQTLHTHTMVFIPRKPGQLDIQGCLIKFSTCKSQEFWLLDNLSRRERDIWYDVRGGEFKVKEIGIHSKKMNSSEDPDADQFWPKRKISATVLPPQPVLILQGCPLGGAAIMLLEGETFGPFLQLSLTLQKAI